MIFIHILSLELQILTAVSKRLLSHEEFVKAIFLHKEHLPEKEVYERAIQTMQRMIEAESRKPSPGFQPQVSFKTNFKTWCVIQGKEFIP